LRLLTLLAAAEETCNAGKKAATLLASWRGRVRLRNLSFEGAYSVLRVGERVLHHERTLGKKIGSGRIFGHLAPNQLISLWVPRLVTCRRQSIEQTGYEVSFIGCHKERKPGSDIFTSAWFGKVEDRNQKSEIRIQNSEFRSRTSNPEPRTPTPNSEPRTPKPELQTPNSKPRTPNPELQPAFPTPCRS